jgi:hypothetical protein
MMMMLLNTLDSPEAFSRDQAGVKTWLNRKYVKL